MQNIPVSSSHVKNFQLHDGGSIAADREDERQLVAGNGIPSVTYPRTMKSTSVVHCSDVFPTGSCKFSNVVGRDRSRASNLVASKVVDLFSCAVGADVEDCDEFGSDCLKNEEFVTK